jgi:hypothetical protein
MGLSSAVIRKEFAAVTAVIYPQVALSRPLSGNTFGDFCERGETFLQSRVLVLQFRNRLSQLFKFCHSSSLQLQIRNSGFRSFA